MRPSSTPTSRRSLRMRPSGRSFDYSPHQVMRSAKRSGRNATMRPGWDAIKIDVMRKLLRLKFSPGSPLAIQLISTGTSKLVEGNTWGDRFWGVCGGTGENHLGRLLMETRDYLNAMNSAFDGHLVTSATLYAVNDDEANAQVTSATLYAVNDDEANAQVLRAYNALQLLDG